MVKHTAILFNGEDKPVWLREGDMAGKDFMYLETVHVTFGGKGTILAFVPQPDLTPIESYYVQRLTHGGQGGSEMAFILQHDLLRHFYEMPEKPLPKPEPATEWPPLSEYTFSEMLRSMDEMQVTHENNQTNRYWATQDDAIVGAAESREMKRVLASVLSKIKQVKLDKERQERYEKMREELLKREEDELLKAVKRDL